MEEKIRGKIELTNEQWRDLVWDEFLEVDGKEVEIEEVEGGYDGSKRHTEKHYYIFKRLSDGKIFRVDYETSVKDGMGWEECNYGDTEAIEVFPKVIQRTIYE